jgi:phosphoglycolate phosphatase
VNTNGRNAERGIAFAKAASSVKPVDMAVSWAQSAIFKFLQRAGKCIKIHDSRAFFIIFDKSRQNYGLIMIELRNYKHIIWDWNGTLLDDAWLCVDVMNGMLAERNLPQKTLDQYKELFDFPVKDYYVKLGFDFGKEPFDEVGMEFIVRYNRRQCETALHPEVQDVLTSIVRLGLTQHILSAREQNELIAETKNLGVFNYFNQIRGLDDHYAHGKTDIGLLLVKDIGIDKKNILFIGDTRHDAEVASGIGIDCLLIPNGHHSKDRLKKLGVPIMESLKYLI